MFRCFNPRTHTGCDPLHKICNAKITKVSIHAPTRGATEDFICARSFGQVSIHAPTRGATHQCKDAGEDSQKFQSTHPHGVRPLHPCKAVAIRYVSIHAPTRGATLAHFRMAFAPSCFNPRTHTGCDSFELLESYQISKVSIHAPTRGATASGMMRKSSGLRNCLKIIQ